MADRMRGSIRFVLFLVVFGVLAVAAKIGFATKVGQKVGAKIADVAKGNSSITLHTVDQIDGKEAINVCVVTWGGYAGGEYFNKGFPASKASRFWTEYQLPVNFVTIEDFDPSRKAWT